MSNWLDLLFFVEQLDSVTSIFLKYFLWGLKLKMVGHSSIIGLLTEYLETFKSESL